MTYDQYQARFYATVPLLPLPIDTVVGLPLFASAVPTVWHFKWEIEFKSDGHYIYCREAWSARKAKPARRYKFSFHYGPGPQRDANGGIIIDPKIPVVLRCDQTSHTPEHIHYLGPDHYEQDRVQGLVIDKIDLFQFVWAVLRHRSTKDPLDKILGFKVA
ncbi:MAG: hypothetical protein ACM3JB_23730 [Acidobacteriaceae bacterium]